jgi:hypothetical protein
MLSVTCYQNACFRTSVLGVDEKKISPIPLPKKTQCSVFDFSPSRTSLLIPSQILIQLMELQWNAPVFIPPS